MAGQQVIDKIANDRIGFVPESGDDPADQSAAAAVPLQVDRAAKITGAMNLGPALCPPRLFGPHLDEAKLLFQLRITHDFGAQGTAPGGDDLNEGLHLSLLGSPTGSGFAMICF